VLIRLCLLIGLGVASVALLTSARQFPPHRDGGSTLGARHRSQVQLVLKGVLEDPDTVRKYRFPPREPDWRKERRLSGIGWELGTAARPDGYVMTAALTAVQPAHVMPFSLPNCYVLAGFDLRPSGILLVTVRDPRSHWIDAPEIQAHNALPEPDSLDLVWYDEGWIEQRHQALAFEAGEFPEDFVLSPAQNYLLCIRRPMKAGKPLAEGASLCLIWLADGTITDVHLPEVSGAGFYPAAWQPLGMQFQQGGKELAVKAGQQVRVYDINWLR
jgi:hypothetical protein